MSSIEKREALPLGAADVLGEVLVDAAPAAAAGDPSPKPSPWLWIIYPLTTFGSFVAGGANGLMVTKQVSLLMNNPSAEAGTLGLVTSLSACASLVAGPLLGRLSDRTKSRFLGRRNIWVLGSALFSAIPLYFVAHANNLVLLAFMYALLTTIWAGSGAALTAVLPERFPVYRRGTMSGLIGMLMILGAYLGIVLASGAKTIGGGYWPAELVAVAILVLFALTTKDAPADRAESEPREAAETKAKSFPTPRQAPDFWWAFAGRFMIVLGYYLVAGFGVYILKDYIKVGGGSLTAAVQDSVEVSGAGTLALVLASLIGGVLSDRFKRVKVFVGVGSLLFIPGAVLMLVAPSLSSMIIASAVFGAAFGLYYAVDQVLITRVLPNMDNPARDLGILNIANAAPQVLGPLVAGFLVSVLGSYQSLYYLMIIPVVLGAVTIRFIRTVR